MSNRLTKPASASCGQMPPGLSRERASFKNQGTLTRSDPMLSSSRFGVGVRSGRRVVR